MSGSDSSAERVRKLSDAEIHYYLVGHTLFGIGFGAAFARYFFAYSLPCAIGGMAVGVMLMVVVWRSMIRRSAGR